MRIRKQNVVFLTVRNFTEKHFYYFLNKKDKISNKYNLHHGIYNSFTDAVSNRNIV
jgi:hypothetical protein